MALKEKRILSTVLVCDNCESDIPENTGTHIEGTASGYMKKDGLELDFCESCAARIGLKRRGRRPGTVATKSETTKRKRGRPRKQDKEPELVAVASNSSDDNDGWES